MKKYIIIIIALLFSLSVTAQRKTVTDKLQVTGVKNAEILSTDSKGNLVAGTLPEIPEGKTAEEICAEEWEGISIEVLNTYPIKNSNSFYYRDTSLSDEGGYHISTELRLVESDYDKFTNFDECRIYFTVDKKVTFIQRSNDAWEIYKSYDAGKIDVTDYVKITTKMKNNGESLDSIFIANNYACEAYFIIADDAFREASFSVDLEKVKPKQMSICKKIQEISDKIMLKKTPTIYDTDGKITSPSGPRKVDLSETGLIFFDGKTRTNNYLDNFEGLSEPIDGYGMSIGKSFMVNTTNSKPYAVKSLLKVGDSGIRSICKNPSGEVSYVKVDDSKVVIHTENSDITVNDGSVSIGGVVKLRTLQFYKSYSVPKNPQAGTIYYDNADNVLKCYDGTVWQNLW